MLHLNLWAFAITHDMFHLTLPVAEKLFRPMIVYAFLVLLLRIFGKRELATLNPFDLVVLLSLSNTVQNAIIGDDNSVTGGLFGAFALLLVNYVVVRFLFKHRRLDQILEGGPLVLIDKGKIQKRALAKEFMTEPELLVVAHRQGFSSLKEIEKCILEPTGSFYLEGKTPPRPEQRHNEIVARLDQLSRQIEGLRQQPGQTNHN